MIELAGLNGSSAHTMRSIPLPRKSNQQPIRQPQHINPDIENYFKMVFPYRSRLPERQLPKITIGEVGEQDREGEVWDNLGDFA